MNKMSGAELLLQIKPFEPICSRSTALEVHGFEKLPTFEILGGVVTAKTDNFLSLRSAFESHGWRVKSLSASI
jgi:hypothetical protein